MIRSTLCYIEQNGKYLMLFRNKKKEDPNEGKWIGVGGKLEAGETAEDCVIREVKEETGLILTGYERVGLVKFVSDCYENEDMYLYLGTSFEGELTSECDEGELAWISKEEILSLPMWEGDVYFLKALLNGQRNINMTLRYEGATLVEVKDYVGKMECETSELLQYPHGFSTRYGGVSENIWESLNLGMNRGDDPERVNENWRRLLEHLHMPMKGMVWGKQVHGSYVHVATKKDLAPIGQHEPMREADGYVTKECGLPLVAFTADCVPILLEDYKNGIIGAVHSGWRGTVANIVKEAIIQMLSLGAELSEICVAIGPAIGSCCFEVGPEVVEEVDGLLGDIGKNYYTSRGDKYLLDLRGVIRESLLREGILQEHIDIVGGCTMCQPKRFWSHRYTKGMRGSQAAVIMLP